MRYFDDDKLNNLAMRLRAFAEAEGAARGIVFWRVLRNKSIVSICNELPTTIEELRSKKVLVGEKVIRKYGVNIVGIVNEWRESYERKQHLSSVESPVSLSKYNDTVMVIRQEGDYYRVSGNDR